MDKISKKTEKVSYEMSFKDAYYMMIATKKLYTMHKYVYNDTFHCPNILSTTTDIGEIYHLDYSENIAQQYKYEPQSAHFSKRQFSLHCTVKHTPTLNEYIYHLSDEMRHDHVFTTTVLRHLIDQSESNIIRIKSDNCSTQYKSKYVFKAWQTVASETGKTLITFYGASGHGKGLVDAMSSFGVKAPICKAILTEDFSYQSSQDIYDYLIYRFKDDNKKHFHVITQNNIENQRELLKYSYIIPNCRALHMISFFPDCSIQTKRHLAMNVLLGTSLIALLIQE